MKFFKKLHKHYFEEIGKPYEEVFQQIIVEHKKKAKFILYCKCGETKIKYASLVFQTTDN